jgi:hypothetical protein
LEAAKKEKMDETQVEKFRKDLEYIRLAARQTENDFGRLGYVIELSEHPAGFAQLCNELKQVLLPICNSPGQRLEGLLYHIDVPGHMMHPLNVCKDLYRTSEVILQRELIKVVMKKLYS